MAPIVPVFVKQVLSAAKVAPVPGLSVAIETLEACICLYEGVQTNREACSSLLERAADLTSKVNDALKDVGEKDEVMRKSIQQLSKSLSTVGDALRLAGTRNWLYWTFHQDEIAHAVTVANQSIDDGFRVLGVKADVAIYNQIKEIKAIQRQQSIDIVAHLNTEPKPSTFSLRDQELRTALRRLLLENANDKESLAVHQALKAILGNEAEGDLPPYTITSYEIAKGAMMHQGSYSTVWEGRWQNCRVAIKELSKEVARDDLERQISIWSGLRHENILQFYGVSLSSEVPFIVSPLMTNGTVMDYIKANPSASRIPFIKGIAAGMQYLHSRNFVHGNLQGENVLINASGNACLSGFGLVKIKHDALSRSTDEAFKKRNSEAQRAWMSPERLMGKSTRKTDIWAFGMTMHEVLSGNRPFSGVDAQTIRKQIMVSSKTPIWSQLLQPEDADGEYHKVRPIMERCIVYDANARPTFEAISVMLSIV